MKSKVLHVIIIALCAMSVSSCSKDESEKRIEFAKIVESRTSQDLLNDLYVGSDADLEAIARIMNVTPSSIERIRNGKLSQQLNLKNAYVKCHCIICKMTNHSQNCNQLLTLNTVGLILYLIFLPITLGGFGPLI